MQRAFLALGSILVFGVGLAVGSVYTHGDTTAPQAEDPQGVVSRLRHEINTLRTEVRDKDAKLAWLRERMRHTGSALPYRSDPLADGLEPSPGPRRNRSGPDRVARAEVAQERAAQRAAVTTPLTVDAATQLFRKYVADMNRSGGPGGWWQGRELLDQLRAMGPAGAQMLMDVLANSGNSDERRAAATLLGALQDQRALPLFQNILDNDSDVLLRRAAAQGLRRLDSPDAVPLMNALLSNPAEDRYVRMSAAYGLAQMDSVNGLNGLVQIFNEADADGRGRDMAFRSIVSLNDDRTLPFMRQVMTTAPEPSFRLQAIQFVESQGDRQALGTLQRVMQTPTEQPSIREAATRAYQYISSR